MRVQKRMHTTILLLPSPVFMALEIIASTAATIIATAKNQ